MNICRNESTLTQPRRRIRSLGVHERLMYLYSQEHPRHFCVVGELSGRFGILELGNALEQVQQRHPHLLLAIQDDGSGPFFVEDPRPIPVRLDMGGHALEWEAHVEAELREAIPTSQGPLMRMTILSDRSKPARWVIILTFHHAIGDGLSAVAFLKDLVAVLNGAMLPAAVQRLPVEALIAQLQTQSANTGRGGPRPIADKRLLEEIARQPLWRAFNGDRPKVSSVRFSRSMTAAIVERCRSERTTVQGALSAALVAANASSHPKDTYSIATPIDMRALAHVDRTEIGLYCLATSIRFPLQQESGFWSVARRFTETLSPARSDTGLTQTNDWLETTLPSTATADMACGVFGSMAYDAVISNLGRLDHGGDDAGEIRLTGVWGPMVLGRITNERMIGAATIGDCLSLTETAAEHMQPSLANMTSRILAACGLNVHA